MCRGGGVEKVGGGGISFSAAIGQLSVHFSVRLAFDEVLATIPMGFTSTEADEDFEATIFQVALEGDEGAAALFFDLAEKADDFGAMQQKFAGAFGFEIGTVSMAVGGDVKRV